VLAFAELWREAERLATVFRAAGVREGGVTGLALGNSGLFPAAFLALCRLDATVALLPPQYGRSELIAIADGIALSSIVADADSRPRICAAIPIANALAESGLWLLTPASTSDAGSVQDDEPLLKFSSGSTAQPKGIALTAANVLAEAENVTATLELGAGDRILSGVPLFHSYGFDLGVLPMLHAGTTLVLESSFVPRRTMRKLARVSAFLGVPAQYRAFLSVARDKPLELSAVRWLLSCTAPLAPETVTEFSARFGVPICQHYGSSETGAVTNHVPAVESGAVARRYVLGAPPGESPLRHGVFRTGDLGSIDPDGFLTIDGRRDAMINVGGLKVSPAEVAATLERHPGVREAAVLGFPDGRGEEVVYAVVESSGELEEDELVRWCRESLAAHKVPRRIEIRATLPRTATGKVRLGVDDLHA
jgi:acyl-CoA synthetase (AMP-forming)/AMP-acid ligase II